MKRTIKTTGLFLIIVITAVLSTVSVFADGNKELTINGKTAKAGDTVTYTINLGDVPTPIAGIQMYIYYDSDVLELDKESVKYEELKAVIDNLDKKDLIIIVCSEGVNGFDFKEKKELVTASFKVKKAGNTDITYSISELYDIYEFDSDNYLKRYTLSYDLAVNDEKVIDAKPPIIKKDTEYTGAFVQNEDGKGEDNGKPTEEIKPTTTINTKDKNNLNSNNATGKNQKGENNEKGSGDGLLSNKGTLITIIGIGVILIAIIIVAITKRQDTKKSSRDKTEK